MCVGLVSAGELTASRLTSSCREGRSSERPSLFVDPPCLAQNLVDGDSARLSACRALVELEALKVCDLDVVSPLTDSQEKLEFASGLHRTYVSSVERGERNPGFEAIARWLASLKVSWREFGEALDGQVKRS